MLKKSSVLIIAEIGSIHDGSLGNALKAIDACVSCGADIVKFQTHIAEAETLENAPSPSFFDGESRFDYFKRTSFSINEWLKIATHCKKRNVKFLSSPFSLEAVDLLEKVGVESYKIPSGEVTNIPLLEKIVKTKKHVLLSSGMSNWEELDSAVKVLKRGGLLTILQCSSIYPCPPEKVGLNAMVEMGERYKIPIGFSDHTTGMAASISAVALGCSIIEKHFTFSKLMYGSDAKNSMEPEEFSKFCKQVKEASIIRNNPIDKNEIGEYKEMKIVFQKSIVASKDLKKGDTISFSDLSFKKPDNGISASEYKKLIGCSINKNINSFDKIQWEDLK
tara:strand:- start:3507 stop:4508 length:1002 start_codon:yes stop_codon:yes gene_type:complete